MMEEELDIRRHPKIAVKRSVLGMDWNAGLLTIGGVVVGLLVGASGFMNDYKVLSALAGFGISFGVFVFARKFIHAKPPTYISDWMQSKFQPDYIPKPRTPKRH